MSENSRVDGTAAGRPTDGATSGAAEPATSAQHAEPPPETKPLDLGAAADEGAAGSGGERAAPEEPTVRGTMRFQDPESATPRPPTVAEQRARARAEQEEREREEAEQAEAERKRRRKKRLLIGGGVTVGVAALVAAGYALASPEEVSATCVDQNNVAVPEEDCDQNYVASHGGYNSGGIFFLPGFGQYRYYYGPSPFHVGQTVSGGTFTKPDNATIRTGSGKTIQRGGFGIKGFSGKSGGGS
ncbi:hypothetical protein [Gandjariella thermophila]|uniref:Tat pathway signal protein n=1 Tax=Gandjariella thermophila TaxID=1931992 RepID=A0A4D4J6T3_9PSEU|nr:hypothetical protein [Gandjariella thermophila]GDY31204.1 hypothetical protein GTS_28370 [Gandjariella thermophila]